MAFESVLLTQDQLDVPFLNLERGVPSSDTPTYLSRLERVHWDDLRLFTQLVGETSLRRASVNLRTSINTIRARITRLEDELGTILFIRNRDGLKITAEGRAVLDVALDMQLMSNRLKGDAGNNILMREGELSITTSDGLGTLWLTPRIGELRNRLNGLTVSLCNEFDQSQRLNRRSDLTIGFNRPDDQEMVISKLATLHFMVFAADKYVRERGSMTSLDETGGHEYVEHDAPGLNPAALRLLVGTEAAERMTAVKVNTSLALYWAVASGVGLAALPTYIRSISKQFIPQPLPVRLKFDLWLSYDRTLRRSAPVRAAIEWLRATFDPVRYPWFRDEFIHPDDFCDRNADSHVVSLFDHLIESPN
jgi:DNA-binding transcriptional LysR family regulator